MKELTIEEKAKRYDEALERAQALYNDKNEIGYANAESVLEEVFPLLKESEDERIRKEIINYFAKGKEYLSLCSIGKDDILAWLEKQGEPKSIWHNEDEEPKIDSLILLIMQSGTPIVAKIIEPNHTFNHGERWAYIDDLLEKQGKQKLPIEKLPSEMKTIGESLGFTTQKECNEYNQMVSDLIMSDGNEIKPKFKVGDTIRLKNSTAEYTIESISGGCYHGRGWGLNIIDADKSGDYVLVEQKPANKVEPKFRVGDWITDGNITIQIEAIKNDCYLYCGDCALYSIKTADKVYHLWTIKDAKDGDVLATEGFVFIFKEIREDKGVGYFCANENALHEGDDNTFYIANTNSLMGSINNDFTHYTPATKEQRDLLFQKMKEAGYEWDADKKELKKIEQKPTEIVKWSPQEESCICQLESLVKEQWRQAERVHNSINIKKMSELMFFLKTLNPNKKPQRIISAEAKEAMYDKPTWSEEDETRLTNTIIMLKEGASLHFNKKDITKAVEWLKSLKPRWKPSDEQMEALKEACDEHWEPDGLDPLYTLYQDLKKLKEDFRNYMEGE